MVINDCIPSLELTHISQLVCIAVDCLSSCGELERASDQFDRAIGALLDAAQFCGTLPPRTNEAIIKSLLSHAKNMKFRMDFNRVGCLAKSCIGLCSPSIFPGVFLD